MREHVLKLKNLKVAFPGAHGVVRAVEGIDLSIAAGECLALVGESGCGKSVTSLATMKLLDPSFAVVRTDEHWLCGEDVCAYSNRQMERLRGGGVSMIFQDALSALNPVMTIGKQMNEIYFRHLNLSKKEAKERAIEALSMVGIPDPRARYNAFPHELSGGMRQRVLVAMAFACEPALIIADEPTTALDVTIQAQILDLLKKLQVQHRTALLLISHDLSVVVHMADRIAVMYSGKIVEEAPTEILFANPQHPYTKGLLSAIVQIDDNKGRFIQIPGALPDPAHKPSGCYFNPRCAYANEHCKTVMPVLKEQTTKHLVRCHLCGGDEYGA